MIYTLRDKLTVFYYKTLDERQNHDLPGDIDEVPGVALLIGLYCHLNKLNELWLYIALGPFAYREITHLDSSRVGWGVGNN